MEELDDLLRRYELLAEKDKAARKTARDKLLALIDRAFSREGFSERYQESVWNACSQKSDAAALQKANGGIPPKKDFADEVRESGEYAAELSRLIHKDENYIFAQKARKHPEEFLSDRGMKLILRLLPAEERELAESLRKDLRRTDSAFVSEYLASFDLEELSLPLLRKAERAARETILRSKRMNDAFVRYLLSGEADDSERELAIYRLLGIDSFSELPALAADVLSGMLPEFERAKEIAEELGEGKSLFAAMRESVIAAGLDFRLSAQLLSAFTTRTLLALAKENPCVSQCAKDEIVRWESREKARDELRYNIVTAMPEAYKDLYPATRTMKRRFIIHSGPTNSGKTYSGMQALMRRENGVYLAPLRLLALEKSDELIEAGFPCDLRTGEEERLIEGASFTSSTVELADLTVRYQCAVIDECQMMTDPVRGGAWTAAILGLQAEEIHLCMSPWAVEIVLPLIEECGDDYEILTHERATPLSVEKRPVRFPDDVRDYDALIAFSRKSVHAIASRLEQAGKKCSVIYGNLPYDVRQNEASKFRKGETKIVVATDAVGLGLNLPIRRVVFMETQKFDGKELRGLEAEEIRQIAGRAGRRGIFEEGFVSSAEGDFLRDIADSLYRFQTEHSVPMFGFPRQLLGIESPVSVLMTEWMAIPPLPGFRKAELEEQIMLAEKAEAFLDDRSLVYRLCMIPFDTKDEELLELWTLLTKILARGGLGSVQPPEADLSMKLLDLEHQFRAYDIYFHFGRLFELDRLKNEAMERKNTVSKRIIQLLDAKGKELRKCPQCGCVLSWNYSYRLCENCYAKLGPRKFSRKNVRR